MKQILIVNCRSNKVRYLPQYELFLSNRLEEKLGIVPKILTVFPKSNFLKILREIQKKELVIFWESFSTKAYSYLSIYLHLAKFLKKRIETPLMFGGYWATTHGRYFKEFDVFDYILEGFSIERIAEVLVHFPSFDGKFINVRGQLDWNKYELNLKYLCNKYDYFRDRILWGYLTSFSCPRNCKFCSVNAFRNYGTDFSARDIEKIKNDVELFIKEFHNLKGVIIKDLNFFYDKRRAFQILEYLSFRSLNIEVNLDATVEEMDEDFFKRISKLGVCRNVYFGLESFSEDTRRKVGKYYSSEALQRVFGLSEKYDISLTGNVILGFPWQSKESIIEEIKEALFYINRFKNVYIMMNVYKPEYGTELQIRYFNDLHLKINFFQLIELYRNKVRYSQETIYGSRFNSLNLEEVFNCFRVIAHLKRYRYKLNFNISRELFLFLENIYKNQANQLFSRNKFVRFTLRRETTDFLLNYVLRTLYRVLLFIDKCFVASNVTD